MWAIPASLAQSHPLAWIFEYEGCCLLEAEPRPGRGDSLREESWILAKICEHKQQGMNCREWAQINGQFEWFQGPAWSHFQIFIFRNGRKWRQKAAPGAGVSLGGDTASSWQVKGSSSLTNPIALTTADSHFLGCWYAQSCLRSLTFPFKIPWILMSSVTKSMTR